MFKKKKKKCSISYKLTFICTGQFIGASGEIVM